MPNTPSAIKRLKQSQKRRMANRIAKKVIKTYTKRTLASLAAGDMEKAQVDFKATVSKLDKPVFAAFCTRTRLPAARPV